MLYNTDMWKSLEKKYLDRPLSQGFVSLYTGKTITMVASALLGLFLPIFLYELFNKNFQAVIIYYGLGFLLYGLTVSFGAKFLNKFGFRKSLRLSVILGVLFYIIFYYLDQNNLKYLIPLSLFVLTFYYWLPYHVDFAKFTNKRDRTRQVSIIEATRSALKVFGPLISGFVIVRFNFDVLFVIAIILYFCSGISYLTIPRTREKFSWTWRKTWQEFFSKQRRRIVLAYTADGAEIVISMIVWPIFIYQLLDGNYFQVGAISTLIIGTTVILQIFLGKYIDLKNLKGRVLGWGSFFYALGWLIKIFIVTAFEIFVAGAYHNLTRIFLRTPFDTLTYDIAADQGHYVDEFTVLHEMAVNFGKVIMVILVIIASLYLPLKWVFILAALSAIVLNILKAEKREQPEC
jgi:MFS family permease